MDAKDISAAFEAAKLAGLIPAPPAQAQTGVGSFLANVPAAPSDAMRDRELALRVAEERMRMQQEADYTRRLSGFGWSVGSYGIVGGLCLIVGVLLGLSWRERRQVSYR